MGFCQFGNIFMDGGGAAGIGLVFVHEIKVQYGLTKEVLFISHLVLHM